MLIIKLGILLCYLHISALATTDIMRLLSNSTVSVFDSKCYCSECGHKISLIYQIPILSYIITAGKCPYCKKHIDRMNFYLEVFSYISYLIVILAFDFRPVGILLSFVLYEVAKICIISIKGRKKNNFFREYFLSLLTNAFVFSLVGFLTVLNSFIIETQ